MGARLVRLYCADYRVPKAIAVPAGCSFGYVQVKVGRKLGIDSGMVTLWRKGGRECVYTQAPRTNGEALDVVVGLDRIHRMRMKYGSWCNPDYAAWHST